MSKKRIFVFALITIFLSFIFYAQTLSIDRNRKENNISKKVLQTVQEQGGIHKGDTLQLAISLASIAINESDLNFATQLLEAGLNLLIEAHQNGDARHELLEQIIRGYTNVANWKQKNLGQFREAEELINTCLLKIEQFKERYDYYQPYRKGRAFHILGQIYMEIMGVSETTFAFKNAIKSYQNPIITKWSRDKKKFNVAQVNHDLSIVYRMWNDLDSSQYYSRESISVYLSLYSKLSTKKNEERDSSKKDGIQAFINDIIDELISAYISASYMHENKKEYTKSLQSINKANALLNTYKVNDSPQKDEIIWDILSGKHSTANLDLNFYEQIEDSYYIDEMFVIQAQKGSIFTNLNKIPEAEYSNGLAIQLLENMLKNRPTEFYWIQLAKHIHNKAEILYVKGSHDLALQFQDEAIDILVKRAGGNQDVIPNPLLYLEFLTVKAKTLFQLNRNAEAGMVFDEAIGYLDHIRGSYQNAESKIKLREIRNQLFEAAIQNCFILGKNELAFKYSEQSKSFILLENVTKEYLQSQFDPFLLEKQYNTEWEIAQLKMELIQSTVESRDSILNNIQKAQNELNEVNLELSRNTQYSNIINQLPYLSSSEIAKKILDQDQTLIEYFVGEETITAFVINSNGKMDVVPITQDLDSIKFWSNGLSKYISSIDDKAIEKKERMAKITNYGFQIFDAIVQPLLKYIEHKRVVIVPDDVLHFVPFDALLTMRIEKESSFINYPFLGKKWAISYNYSAALMSKMQITKKPENYLLAFAPSFPPAFIAQRRFALVELKFIEDEVVAIQELFPNGQSEVVIGPKATKKLLINRLQNVKRPISFLHFATHGVAIDEIPGQSFISFAQKDKNPDPKEFLYAEELYQLNIPAQTVVLSACSTNSGRIKKGEGMMSFARAFAFAGVNSIVTPIFPIDDEQSKNLMVNFYQNHLKDLQPKDVALQYAKQSIYDMKFAGKTLNVELADPYYWSGFMLIGNSSNEVKVENNWGLNSLVQILAITIILLVAFVWGFRRLNKK